MTMARGSLVTLLSLAIGLASVGAAEAPPAKAPAKAAPAAEEAKAPPDEASAEGEETRAQRRERLAALYEQAEAHFQARRYREAQRLYAQIALEQPGYRRVNARLRTIRDRLAEAERLARQARLDRLLEAAEAHFQAANYQAAVQACEDALLLDPQNAHAQKRLAEAAGELELQRRITAAIAGPGGEPAGPEVVAQAPSALQPRDQQPAEPKTPAAPAAPAVRPDEAPPPPKATRRVGPDVNVEVIEAEQPPATPAPDQADPEGRRLLTQAWDAYQAAKLAEDPRPKLREALDILAPITPQSAYSRHTKGTAALLRKSIARHLAGGPESISAADQHQARLYRRYLEGEEALRKRQYEKAVAIAEEILAEQPHFPLARHLHQEAGMALLDTTREEKELEHELRSGRRILEVAEAGAPPDKAPPLERPLIDLTRPTYEVTTPELEERLNQRVSVNLIDADLDYFLDLLFRSTGVNLIYNPEVVAGKTITVHVANYPLRQLLDYIARNHGLMFSATRDGILITTPEEPRLETFIVPLHHGLVDVEEAPPAGAIAGEGGAGEPIPPFTTSNVEKLVENFPSLIDWPQGSFTYLDRKMNILYLRTTHEAYAQALRLIESIDTQPIQALVRALFVEVSAEELDRFGTEFEMLTDDNLFDTNLKRRIHWTLNKGSGLAFPGETVPGAPAVSPEGAEPGLNLSFTGILDQEKFRLTLDLLQRLKSARTLAAPSVVCMNNCTARIAVTKDLVYIEDYEIDRADISGTTYQYPYYQYQQQQQQQQPYNYPQYPLSSEPVVVPVFAEGEDTGYTLDVSPSIGKDTRFITITLNPRIRDLAEEKSYDVVLPYSVRQPLQQNGDADGDDDDDDDGAQTQTATVTRPVISERSLTTKLTVADGSVVAIGGLMTQDQVSVRSKIPILSDIPVLGALFGRRTFGTKKTNLLIFVQCEIITPTGARYADSGEVDETAPPRGTPRVDVGEGTAPVVRPEPQP